MWRRTRRKAKTCHVRHSLEMCLSSEASYHHGQVRKKKIAANKQNQTTIKRKQDKGKHYNQKKKKKNHSLEAFKM